MDIKLSCKCGKLQGVATNVTPQNGNRVVCCCDDCQAIAHHLKIADDVLDEFGGTDLYQTSQSQVQITQGAELLRSAGIPFVGVVHTFMSHQSSRTNELGPVLTYVQAQHATATPQHPQVAQKFPFGITLRIIRKILFWKITGKGKPSAFYDEQGKARSKPIVISE